MLVQTHRIPGLILKNHVFEVPLDHAQPQGEKIQVFAREVVAPDNEQANQPWLLFLQGGPGFGASRPEDRSGWISRALKDYRVLLLDQRGTGLSTPVLPQTLAALPTPQAQADYLKHFRADSIVQDAELIRQELAGGEPWSVLGQSYGGFCALHYLSAAPQGLREVLFTGGLASLDRPVDDVYRATYQRVMQKNRLYFERYPEDATLAQEIVEYLSGHDVRLPGGGKLTPRRFQQLGMDFGASNGFEHVHYLLESAFVRGKAGRELADPFLRQVEDQGSFETNPIYALLHEAIYCQSQASYWSAERVRKEYPAFDITPGQPVYFTGEMIYPWMFEDYALLQPLKAAAEILAAYESWPRLYDLERLSHNRVPCAAAVYYNDMYVERTFSEETAAAIPGLRTWVTSEHEHSALRLYGEQVVDHLLGMLHGER